MRAAVHALLAGAPGHGRVMLDQCGLVPVHALANTALSPLFVYSFLPGPIAGVDSGTHANVPALRIAIDYWKLGPDARLREVIVAVRADETHHRDVNHQFANDLA